MADLPSRDAFAGCLNTRFRLMDGPEASFDLELAEVSELKVASRQQFFSIYFEGPASQLLSQRIYRLSHDTLGEMDLFLVPIAKRGESILYEVVFNHLVSPA